ncbi:MAG: YibE/F family protein [Halothermotrichaceae bacterium]
MNYNQKANIQDNVKCTMKNKCLHNTLLIILSIMIMVIFTLPVMSQPDEEYYRGEILSVNNIEGDEYNRESIEQELEAKITTGPHKGKIVTLSNVYVKGREHLNALLEKGMQVIIVAFQTEEGVQFELQDVARDRGLLYLVIGFALLLVGIGWIKGVKTLVSLVFTALIIWKVMFPLLLMGYSPIPVAVLSAVIIIVFILVVIGGFNYKTLAAIIGTGVGVLVAGALAYFIGEISHLTGFGSNEAQMLLTGDFDIDIRGLLFAGIIIGSLGAITDVAMSIASSAVQIKEANPLIDSKDLMVSAFNVGRDIMGTMSNTLILAYVGGSIHLLLALMRFDINWLRIINMDLIATEVVRGLAGSIGLIISIPVTALAAAELIADR